MLVHKLGRARLFDENLFRVLADPQWCRCVCALELDFCGGHATVRSLDLSKSDVSGEIVHELLLLCPNLRHLSLNYCKDIREATFNFAAEEREFVVLCLLGHGAARGAERTSCISLAPSRFNFVVWTTVPSMQ